MGTLHHIGQLPHVWLSLLVGHQVGAFIGQPNDGGRINIHHHPGRIVVEGHRYIDCLADRLQILIYSLLWWRDIGRGRHHYTMGPVILGITRQFNT